MFKGLWRSVVRWWRSLLGVRYSKAATAYTELPPLTDPDYEYLFMQLLEGVAHGWQQPRVIKFFQKLKHRAPKSQWLAWINGFGYRLLNATTPNEELARKMIQLSELDCGELTTLAGEYGHQLMGRIYGQIPVDYLDELVKETIPALEFEQVALEPLAFAADSIELSHDPLAFAPPHFDPEATYTQDTADEDLPIFGEVPPELRLAQKSAGVNAEPEIADPPEPNERVLSIEEFAVMLQSDPDLVQEIAQQLGLETSDPQQVLEGVIAQMQEQIQDGQ